MEAVRELIPFAPYVGAMVAEIGEYMKVIFELK